MMTDRDREAWACLLGRTDEERVAVIRELLAYAGEDGMTRADRRVCERQLARLAGVEPCRPRKRRVHRVDHRG